MPTPQYNSRFIQFYRCRVYKDFVQDLWPRVDAAEVLEPSGKEKTEKPEEEETGKKKKKKEKVGFRDRKVNAF